MDPRTPAFTLYGLLRIGFTEEAHSFMQWLDARSEEVEADDTMQIVYGIDGRHDLKERNLDHRWTVIVARRAVQDRRNERLYVQLQLDNFGELLDSLLEIVATVDSIDDLHCVVGLDLLGSRIQPLHEAVRFLRETDPQ